MKLFRAIGRTRSNRVQKRLKYEGFGSFHGENVEKMLLSDNWRPPQMPFDDEEFLPKDVPKQFGSEMKKYFLLSPQVSYLNHGAFGATALPMLQSAQKWQNYAQLNPLKWYDRELFQYLVSAMRTFAPTVGANHQDMVFVPNVTSALNAILNSIQFREGDEFRERKELKKGGKEKEKSKKKRKKNKNKKKRIKEKEKLEINFFMSSRRKFF